MYPKCTELLSLCNENFTKKCDYLLKELALKLSIAPQSSIVDDFMIIIWNTTGIKKSAAKDSGRVWYEDYVPELYYSALD